MKVLITGGLGFIGGTLAARLVAEGHDVLVLDNLSSQIHGDIPAMTPPAGVRVVRLDVRDLRDQHELLEDRDAVFHLAAETGTAQSMYRIAHYVSVNELGSASLLEAIGKCSRRPRRLILASSRSIYGEGAYRDQRGQLAQPLPRTREQLARGTWDHVGGDGVALAPVATPETLGPSPGSVYAATKFAQEMLVASAGPSLELRSILFRFQNVYGEGRSLRNPYTGIISIFFNRARQGLEIPLYEDGLESRDFVHVSDVVEALARSLQADVAPGTVINVGSGVPTSVSDLARTLVDVAGFSVPLRVTGQFRVGDIRHCWADRTRAVALMGLPAPLPLRDGLARFCAWARTQPVAVDRLDQATEELRRKGLA